MIISRLLATLLLVCATPALAEITFSIEEPAPDSTRSGIGLISGWAVSDRGVVSVEAFINGVSLGYLPYGSARGDVAAVFPDIPGSENSGWSMKWAFSISGEGEHTLRVVVTEEGGGTAEKEVVFNVVRFESEFISDPDSVVTGGATVTSPEDGRLLISGARVEDDVVDIGLSWDTASQQFLIDSIDYAGGAEPKLAPSATAGEDFTVEPGTTVSVHGQGDDPDGHITSHFWTQVSGPDVALDGAEDWTVSFTAPEESGTVRLRLTVVDNDEMSADDDVAIEIVDTNSKPEAAAGPDFTVNIGEEVNITGTGSDLDGEIVSYQWKRVAGQYVSLAGANSATVSFTAPLEEGYTRLRLTVTDDDGATDSDEVKISFDDPNKAPTADAGNDFTVEAGDSVTVTGDGSDPDGTIVDWSWSQVSGDPVSLSGADSSEVTFTAPDEATTIRLRLTVTDDGGKSDSDDVYITVNKQLPDSTTGAKLQAMLSAVNDARTTPTTCRGTEYPAQPPLEWSDSLATIAMQHSMDMAAQGYFSHTSADGTSFGDRVFPYWNGTRIGENIAASSNDRSYSDVVDMWLGSSSGHCEAIMSADWTHAGIGFGKDLENGYSFHYFWTLDFGG
jgi:uncharacterized protein YkwD